MSIFRLTVRLLLHHQPISQFQWWMMNHHLIGILRHDIRGCIDCRKCSELGKCVFDDEVNAFVEKAEEFDGFVFGGPVYYGTVNPTLTNFMTRVFFLIIFWRKTYISSKTLSCSSKRQKGWNHDCNRYNQQIFHLGGNADNQLNILECNLRHKSRRSVRGSWRIENHDHSCKEYGLVFKN